MLNADIVKGLTGISVLTIALPLYPPFGEHLATARHQVLVGLCRAGGVYETRLRFNVYKTRRGDAFHKLETSCFPEPGQTGF